MTPKTFSCCFLLALFTFFCTSSHALEPAPDVTSDDCSLCHDGSEEDVAVVEMSHLDGSIHEGFECLDCHSDIAEVPHEDDLLPVHCGECHEGLEAKYIQHGIGLVSVSPGLPGCSDCHGTHQIRPASDPESVTHRSRRAQVCAQCHGDINWAKEHDMRLKNVVDAYEASAHGVVRAADSTSEAAVCTDCHGSERDPHRIYAPGSSLSSINHFNIPNTCGQCHEQEAEDFWDSIHGEFVARGDTHSPVCTDCHGEHGILQLKDPRSNVSPYRVAESTCSPCHETARINEVYDAPLGETVEFVDSFHGLKSRSGDSSVANCASCHGAHKVLPSTNPASSVHRDNLQHTCGECHEGITAEMAQRSVHAVDEAGGWPDIVRKIYIFLIVGVIGGMIAYVSLDFWRGTRRLLHGPQVRRMDGNAIFQHTTLMISFTVLVITGFALRYSEATIFTWMFGWAGGFGVRGVIHRVAAVVFLISTLWHFVYLFRPNGRKFLSGMATGMRDVREVSQAVSYNLGKRKEHPKFGRFSFVEKAEYWALVWGTVVMILTGLLLWFKNDAIGLVSREFVEVMRVIHLYEAWLATLAILVWHMYGVIFKPGVFPGNPSWITGKMPLEMYEEEHPGDPVTPEEPFLVSTVSDDASSEERLQT